MSGSAWPPDPVRDLLRDEERAQRVPADLDYARQIVARVRDEELELALFAASRGHEAKVNTLTYDAARKAVEALLLAAGWRVRAAPGAHSLVGEVVDAWLGSADDPGPRIAARFSAARKARHDDEYPHPMVQARSAKELRAFAQDNVRLVNLCAAELELEERPELVPTDANLERFRH